MKETPPTSKNKVRLAVTENGQIPGPFQAVSFSQSGSRGNGNHNEYHLLHF